MSAKGSNNKCMVVGLGMTGLSTARYLARSGRAFDLCDTRETLPALAELQQEFPQAKIVTGALNGELLSQYDELIVSPGIALAEPAIQQAIAAGVAVAGDIQLFARQCQKPIIAITGSNGKSTVTTLVGELLQAAGMAVGVGGNIGVPALDLGEADIYVLELSSFQLETTTDLSAEVAVILNLSEDHMDRYTGMDDYLQAKQRIFQGARHAVLNRDDAATQPVGCEAEISFGVAVPNGNEFGLIRKDGESWISFGEQAVIAASDLKIKGQHNLANVMASLALVQLVGVDIEKVLPALKDFAGLDHRCQWLGEHEQVSFYNDSKGTNVGSTLAAINGLGPEINGKIWLLAGGEGKGQDFSPLAEPCAEYCAEVLTYGADAMIIANAVSGDVAVSQQDTMKEAFDRALSLAEEGDVILLSPACASFDQFKNYVERGEYFRSLVEEVL